MRFVCSRCRGELTQKNDAYHCAACSRVFPVIAGIPDFRLEPDPYIGVDEDRAKGLALLKVGRERGFQGLLEYYYAVTPEDPADLAKYWKRRALAEVEIAHAILQEHQLQSGEGLLLDVGCSTGGILAAAARPGRTVIGVDVAFRWLCVGSIRLQELGISATLVCANAEALPFPDGLFYTVTAIDLIEHTRNQARALQEGYRVCRPGGTALWIMNNRYAPLPDPQVHLWGVGLLLQRWQAAYVRFRRPDLHTYQVLMLSARTLRKLGLLAGYSEARVRPALLYAPHLQSVGAQWALSAYNRLARTPGFREFLRVVGPKVALRAVKAVAEPAAGSSPSTVGTAT